MGISSAVVLTIAALLNSSHAELLLDAASKAGLTTLVDLVDQAGMVEDLSSRGPFTFLAPTNEAFASLGDEVLEELKGDIGALREILYYHILSGNFSYDDLTASEDSVFASRAESVPVRINVYLRSQFYHGFASANGNRMVKTDIPAENGIIHTLSEVMDPMPVGNITEVLRADSRGQFATFLQSLDAADLLSVVDGQQPLTVFAPTEAAFDELNEEEVNTLMQDKDILRETMLRHIVRGSLFQKGTSWQVHDTLATPEGTEDNQIQTQVFKGGVVKVSSGLETSARVVNPDMVAFNGVVHAIDGLL